MAKTHESQENRSLNDLLGNTYGETTIDRSERRDRKSGNNTNKDEDNLDEQDAKSFMDELDGPDATLDDIESFDSLLKNPQPGSIILAFKDSKRQTKAHVVKFATDNFIPNLLPIFFSDDIPMEMYVIFRMVLPHKRAIAAAEEIGKVSKESGRTPTEILAEMANLDIKTRADLQKVLAKVLNYHPHISRTLGDRKSVV